MESDGSYTDVSVVFLGLYVGECFLKLFWTGYKTRISWIGLRKQENLLVYEILQSACCESSVNVYSSSPAPPSWFSNVPLPLPG